MRRKMGWTARGIVGFIFAPMGLFFLMLGYVLWQSKSATWKHPNDPVIVLFTFGGLGGLFLIVGLALLGADLYRRHLLRRAYDGGNCVDAEIIGIRTQNNVNMASGHPALWNAPGRIRPALCICTAAGICIWMSASC